MPQFGPDSEKQLATCHPELVRLARRVVQTWDCQARCGHRNQADQHAAFVSHHSDKDWPDGNHNKLPSTALDLYPYPIPPETTQGTYVHYMFAGFVCGVAEEMGIKLRCGADWNGNRQITDQRLNDLVHFELVP